MHHVFLSLLITSFMCLFGMQNSALATDATPHDEYLHIFQKSTNDFMYISDDGTKKLLSKIQKEAKAGNAEDQVFLAKLFISGNGVVQDYKKALYWFELSAKQGNAEAQARLGLAYDLGEGVEKDYSKAKNYYELAVKQKNSEAQVNLGIMYAHGKGVEQDYKKTLYYFELAAKQGYATAQRSLATLYAHGWGVEQDNKKAAHWTTLAAKQGDFQAQKNIAAMYLYGEGVKQDHEKSKYWYTLLAETGDVDAQSILADLCYNSESPTQEDYHNAKRWYEEIARKGDKEAKAKAKIVEAKIKAQGFIMDTTDWVTYPIGRYLIDLPKDAIFYWWPFKLAGEELVWKNEMTIKEAKKLLTEKAEKLKKLPHESGESQFVALYVDYVPNSESILLVQRDGEYGSDYLFQTYVVNSDAKNNTDKRVYYYEENGIPEENVKGIEKYIMETISTNIAAREYTKPSDRIANTYFGGGIFFSRGDTHFRLHEEIALDVHFPKYPGISLYINFEHFTNKQTGHRQDLSNGKLFTIVGNPVRELSSKPKPGPDSSVVWPPRHLQPEHEDDGITRYSFFLASEKHNDDGSNIIMRLNNPSGRIVRDGAPPFPPDLKRSSFRSDQEAQAFWETVRDSIRYRPYGWTLETDKKK